MRGQRAAFDQALPSQELPALLEELLPLLQQRVARALAGHAPLTGTHTVFALHALGVLQGDV